MHTQTCAEPNTHTHTHTPLQLREVQMAAARPVVPSTLTRVSNEQDRERCNGIRGWHRGLVTRSPPAPLSVIIFYVLIPWKCPAFHLRSLRGLELGCGAVTGIRVSHGVSTIRNQKQTQTHDHTDTQTQRHRDTHRRTCTHRHRDTETHRQSSVFCRCAVLTLI